MNIRKHDSLSWRFTKAFVSLAAGSILFVLVGFDLLHEWVEEEVSIDQFDLAEEKIADFLTQSEAGTHLLEDYLSSMERNEEKQQARERAVIYGLAAIASLVSLLLGLRLARQLSDPIASLSTATSDLAKGKGPTLVQTNQNAPIEIRQLAQDINLLSLSIAQKEEQLRFSSAAIAHELRTPLTIIQGRLHGLQDGLIALDAKQVPALLARLAELENVITDIEDLSLINGGNLSIQLCKVNISTFVQGYIQDAKHAFPDLCIGGDIAPHPIWVEIDEARIVQVLNNLLTNAQKYAGRSASVTIFLLDSAENITLTVRDDGPGFSEQALQMARSPFWRDDPSRTRETGGSGLGLSVAAAIVEKHHSQLVLENWSQGAQVSFSLNRYTA